MPSGLEDVKCGRGVRVFPPSACVYRGPWARATSLRAQDAGTPPEWTTCCCRPVPGDAGYEVAGRVCSVSPTSGKRTPCSSSATAHGRPSERRHILRESEGAPPRKGLPQPEGGNPKTEVVREAHGPREPGRSECGAPRRARSRGRPRGPARPWAVGGVFKPGLCFQARGEHSALRGPEVQGSGTGESVRENVPGDSKKWHRSQN